MNANAEQLFAAGAYTMAQAAAFAEVRDVSKVRRWLFGSGISRAALIPFYGEDEVVSFIDLVQLMAIRDIRNTRRISLDKIRQTIDTAQRYGIQYPFARKHQTYLFADDVVIQLADGQVIGATGKYKNDRLIPEVAVHPLDDLGFDDDGYANLYTPEEEAGRRIVLSPTNRFGAPVLQPCNYTVEALVCAVQAEGSVLRAARALEVDEKDILMAIRYEERLDRAAA